MDNLKTYRERAKVSRAQLAEKLGVSKRYIFMLEKRERAPSLKIAKLIIQHLHIPEGSIFLLFNCTNSTNLASNCTGDVELSSMEVSK
jgi:DNA-binding XRE family transcriptional regulator